MAKASDPIQIDGSHLEGSGSLLRTALMVSVLTQQPFELTHVRGATDFPGLDVEDISVILAMREMTAAKTSPLDLRAHTLKFEPTKPARALRSAVPMMLNEPRRYPNALVLASTLAPVMATSQSYSETEIEGETFARNSMSYDYFREVIAFAWRKMNLFCEPSITRAAYSRDQRGGVGMTVEPGPINGLKWGERGQPTLMRAVITSSSIGETVIARISSHLQRVVQSARKSIDIDIRKVPGDVPGVFLTAWQQYERGIGGATMMGTRSMRSETMAQSVADELLTWMNSDASVDPIVAEHLVLPATLAHGDTEFTVSNITKRLLTTVWVIKQFSPARITVQGAEGEPGMIHIRGKESVG